MNELKQLQNEIIKKIDNLHDKVYDLETIEERQELFNEIQELEQELTELKAI